MFGNFKKENICPDHFPDFNLGSFIIIKSMFIMKNLTDFSKTVETGVNPHLQRASLTMPPFLSAGTFSASLHIPRSGLLED